MCNNAFIEKLESCKSINIEKIFEDAFELSKGYGDVSKENFSTVICIKNFNSTKEDFYSHLTEIIDIEVVDLFFKITLYEGTLILKLKRQ